jgi:taurine dioxygenase
MSAPLGAVVDGFDVHQTTDQQWRELNTLLGGRHVLVFPSQTLSPDDQLAFARRWGNLIPFPYMALPDYPDLIELRNRGKAKDVNQHWHSDMTYNQKPPKLTMLYAHATPKIGGETAFANQHLAYDQLSSGLKKVLEGLRAHHSAKGLAKLFGEDQGQAPESLHPVIRTHDETGAKALYVCRAFTRRFEGWSREESTNLLDYLFAHSTRPEYQARHQWRPGDLVMWDNRSVLHYAIHDHGDDPRILHRCQVEGVTPI